MTPGTTGTLKKAVAALSVAPAILALLGPEAFVRFFWVSSGVGLPLLAVVTMGPLRLRKVVEAFSLLAGFAALPATAFLLRRADTTMAEVTYVLASTWICVVIFLSSKFLREPANVASPP